MDVRVWNRKAWDRKAADGVQWARPVSAEVVARARRGDWRILLTPTKPVPAAWLDPIQGRDVLCLAGAGGQQGPVLAAAGAKVTVLDNSPGMLALDSQVAEREGLAIRTVEGDMADLGAFDSASFDLIVHPVSNCFVPDIGPVWRECFRVLRPGGSLLAGFMNPAAYLFDMLLMEKEGKLEVVNRLPYSDERDLTPEGRKYLDEAGDALEFSHTLDSQIGDQIEAGFVISGFYEDAFGPEVKDPLTRFMPTMLATRAAKPAGS